MGFQPSLQLCTKADATDAASDDVVATLCTAMACTSVVTWQPSGDAVICCGRLGKMPWGVYELVLLVPFFPVLLWAKNVYQELDTGVCDCRV